MSDFPPVESDDGVATPEPPLEVVHQISYLRSSLKVVLCLLPIWFMVSFGCGILFRDWLDEHAPRVGNAPFGFWMAQQGAVISFVILLVVYAFLMNRLDRKHNITAEN